MRKIFFLLILLIITINVRAISSDELLTPLNNAKLLLEYHYEVRSNGGIDIKVPIPINTSTQIVQLISTNMERDGDTLTYKGSENYKDLYYKALIITRKPYIKNKQYKPQQFFPTINLSKEIIEKAQELRSKAQSRDNSLLFLISIINKWVNENINYTMTDYYVNRFIDPTMVIKERKGVCDEMAGLEVALLQAIGIKAEIVKGLAYSNEKNEWIPHAWIIVGNYSFDPAYDEYSYVDPSHIVLSIGVNSGGVIYKGNGVIINTHYNVEPLNITKAIHIDAKAKPLLREMNQYSYNSIELYINSSREIVIYPKIYSYPTINVWNYPLIIKKGENHYSLPIYLNESLEYGYIYSYPLTIILDGLTINTTVKASRDGGTMKQLINKPLINYIYCTQEIIAYPGQEVNISCRSNEKNIELDYKDVLSSYTKGLEKTFQIVMPNNSRVIYAYRDKEYSNPIVLLPIKPLIINVTLLNHTLWINDKKRLTLSIGRTSGIVYRDINISIDLPFSTYTIFIPFLERNETTFIDIDSSDLYIGRNPLIITITYKDMNNKTFREQRETYIDLKAQGLVRIYYYFKKIVYKTTKNLFKQ